MGDSSNWWSGGGESRTHSSVSTSSGTTTSFGSGAGAVSPNHRAAARRGAARAGAASARGASLRGGRVSVADTRIAATRRWRAHDACAWTLSLLWRARGVRRVHEAAADPRAGGEDVSAVGAKIDWTGSKRRATPARASWQQDGTS